MKRLAVFLGLIASTAAAAAEPRGRLFFTPEQRAAIDARAASASDTDRLATARHRFDGYALDADGRRWLWIDARPAADAPRGWRIEDEAGALRLRAADTSAALAAGDAPGAPLLPAQAQVRIHERKNR